MNIKLTAKEVKNFSGTKIAIGYCDMQNLLRYQERLGYTCGIYGWNFNVFIVDNFVISTGYRGMVGKSVDYNLLHEYELKAEKVDYKLSYEERKEQVNALLKEFLKKVGETK